MSLKGQKTFAYSLTWSQSVSLIHRLNRDNKQRLKLLIALGTFLGLRIGDILKFRWRYFFDDSGNLVNRIKVVEEKTGKERIFGINDDLKSIISNTYSNIGYPVKNECIFVNRWGEVFSKQYLNQEFKRLKNRYKLDVKNFSTHSLRKTFGVAYLEANNYSEKALYFLMRLYNHASLEDTKRYLAITEEEIVEAYEVLTL